MSNLQKNSRNEVTSTTSQKKSNSAVALAANAYLSKKIKDCTIEELKAGLNRVFILLGITHDQIPGAVREDADEETKKAAEAIKAVLIENIFEEFGAKNSLEDLMLAFKWGLSGKLLSDGKKIDVGLYGKIFSFEYICRFMNPYNEFIFNMRQQHPKEFKPAESVKQLVVDSRTPEQIEDDTLRSLERVTANNNKLPPMLPIRECYEALKRAGKLDLTWIKENEMIFKAKQQLKQEAESKRINGSASATVIREFIRETEKADTIEYRVKRLYVEQHLKTFLKPMVAPSVNNASTIASIEEGKISSGHYRYQ